jgi:Helicase associated domain
LTKRLSDIAPVTKFHFSFLSTQWDQMFARLLKFKEETGHCMVPKRYPPEAKLGTWVHTQRMQYRKLTTGINTKKDSETMSDNGADNTSDAGSDKGEDEVLRLTNDRQKRLEAVGFVWSAREGEKGMEQGRITRNSYDDQ